MVGPSKRPIDDVASDGSSGRPSKRIRSEHADDVSSSSVPPRISDISAVRPPKRPVDDLEADTSLPNKKIRLATSVDSTSKQLGNKQSDNTSAIGHLEPEPLVEGDKPSDSPAGFGDSSGTANHVQSGETTPSDQLKTNTHKALLLPVELHDMILQHLWDSDLTCNWRRTLRSCAHACSRWRAAALPHVFRVVACGRTRLKRLSALIHANPDIATWIRRIRFYGRSLPYQDEWLKLLMNVVEDRERWIYQFPSTFGVPLPNLRVFELFGFARLSPRHEDLEAFARWIPQLAKLESVEEFNLLRGQMCSNSMTAIVRAFPNLVRVDLGLVDFTAPNFAVLRNESVANGDDGEDSTTPCTLATTDAVKAVEPSTPVPAVAVEAGVLDALPDNTEDPHSSHEDSKQPVQFPLFHPPPLLQSFSIENTRTEYPQFDLTLLRDWLCPKSLNRSLKSLKISVNIDDRTLAKLISDLGASPALESLSIFTGDGIDYLIECRLDLSTLSNLTDICLHAHELLLQDDHVEGMRYVLSQLNARRLRRLSIVIGFPDGFDSLAGTDAYIAERFEDLDQFIIEVYEDDFRVLEKVRKEVEEMFPLMMKRGILRVDSWDVPYLY
ncbi:unnamed protein product [Somion occarium]|uniref:F-box domain-containing protein n=1 Tax=Somion occarium TaxID=3059160 RepID=A0ABP1DL53_9APHY